MLNTDLFREQIAKHNLTLKQAAKESAIPIITRVSDIEKLPCSAKRLFAAECRATDMFSLALPVPQPCGAEYTAKIIKTE